MSSGKALPSSTRYSSFRSRDSSTCGTPWSCASAPLASSTVRGRLGTAACANEGRKARQGPSCSQSIDARKITRRTRRRAHHPKRIHRCARGDQGYRGAYHTRFGRQVWIRTRRATSTRVVTASHDAMWKQQQKIERGLDARGTYFSDGNDGL